MGLVPRVGLAGCALLLMIATTVSAQPSSLADLAERERARRATIAEKSKVYTNDDLHGGPGLTTGTPPVMLQETNPEVSPGSPPAPDTNVAEASADDDGERGEDYWRNRIMTARDERQRAELMAAALQNRVDGLWADFTARDDPFQRAEIEQNRIAALQELENTEAEMTRLDQELRAIQEEARRAGVPPGWLR